MIFQCLRALKAITHFKNHHIFYLRGILIERRFKYEKSLSLVSLLTKIFQVGFDIIDKILQNRPSKHRCFKCNLKIRDLVYLTTMLVADFNYYYLHF